MRKSNTLWMPACAGMTSGATFYETINLDEFAKGHQRVISCLNHEEHEVEFILFFGLLRDLRALRGEFSDFLRGHPSHFQKSLTSNLGPQHLKIH